MSVWLKIVLVAVLAGILAAIIGVGLQALGVDHGLARALAVGGAVGLAGPVAALVMRAGRPEA